MSQFSEAAFWQFSLQHYAKEENKNYLLWLQDNMGLNVNLVLCVFYAATCGRLLSLEHCLALHNKIRDLDSLTENFRTHRRCLKSDKITFNSVAYKEALDKELDYEKQQQAELIEQLQLIKFAPNFAVSQSQIDELFKRILQNKNFLSVNLVQKNKEASNEKFIEARRKLSKISANVMNTPK